LDKHLHTYLVENLLEVGTSERDVKFIRQPDRLTDSRKLSKQMAS